MYSNPVALALALALVALVNCVYGGPAPSPTVLETSAATLSTGTATALDLPYISGVVLCSAGGCRTVGNGQSLGVSIKDPAATAWLPQLIVCGPTACATALGGTVSGSATFIHQQGQPQETHPAVEQQTLVKQAL